MKQPFLRTQLLNALCERLRSVINRLLPKVTRVDKLDSADTVAEGNHGGSWKVAAADFFCAMMAFFMVMWILAQDDETLEMIASYFSNPFTSMQDSTAKEFLDASQSNSQSLKESISEKGSEVPNPVLESIAAAFVNGLNLQDQETEQKSFNIKVTDGGLLFTLFNRADKPLFEENSAEFTAYGLFLLQNLAWLIEKETSNFALNVRIAGHTLPDAPQISPEYGPWELSSDQANAVRRTLVKYATSPEAIEKVIGYGNSRPPNDPEIYPQRIEVDLVLNNF